jgi:hypothetical protein
MANDTYIFMVRAALAKTVLEKLPRQCPSWRNTNLQIASLERMAGKFYKRFGGGKASKRRRKAMGAEITKLNKRAKKLAASLNKTLEEGYYKEHPDSRMSRGALRREIAEANREWEGVVREANESFKRKVLSPSAED